MSRISGDKQAVFATLEPRRKLDLVNFHQDFWDISEFTQQDGRKKRTTKRLSVTNLRVLSGIHLTLVALLQKMCLKECEVSEVLADCHTRFAVVFSLPSCCVSSLLFRSQNDIYFSDEREFPVLW